MRYFGYYYARSPMLEIVRAIRPDGAVQPLLPLDHAESYAWGVPCGEGARSLALALLADAAGDAALAERWADAFAREIVANLAETWTIDRQQILQWLVEHDAWPSIDPFDDVEEGQ